MMLKPSCPVCVASAWERIGTTAYRRNDIEKASEFVRLRYDVLFNLWLPDTDEIELEYLLCNACGFVIYSPRPTEEDLAQKYRALTKSDSARPFSASADNPRNRARARDIYQRLRPRLASPPAAILDHGGDDGKLMLPFLEAGYECHLVDYNPNSLPGIRRHGDTLSSLAPEHRFDAALSVHVLEHLADPFSLLADLRDRLREGGVLFVEVPLEIWRGPPRRKEPVTHVNFFTVRSLQFLLERAGFQVLRCREEGYAHPSGGRAVVIRAIAVRRSVPGQPALPGAGPTRELLSPSLWRRVRRAVLNPPNRVRSPVAALLKRSKRNSGT